MYFDDAMKLNFNCPKSYKDGEGQGSCKGYTPGFGKPESKPTKKAEKVTGKSTEVSGTQISEIKTSKDYKSASPESKLAFLQSEIAKGKQSTTLPDGSPIMDIKSKVSQLSKKLGTSPSTKGPKISKEVATSITSTKKAIAKIAQEVKSGKVTPESKQTLKSEVEKLRSSKPQKPLPVKTKVLNEASISEGTKKELATKIEPKADKTTQKNFDEFVASKKTYLDNTQIDISDLSKPETTSVLINLAFFDKSGKDYLDSVVKMANLNAKSDSDKARIETAVWMLNNTKNGNYQKLQNWASYDGKILDYQKGKNKDPGIKEMSDNIEGILRDAPKFNGEVFRGIGNLPDDVYSNILNSKELNWNTLSATTADKNIAMKYATGTVDSGSKGNKNNNSIVFNIKKSKSGVYISDNISFAGLSEVLVPKDSKYIVVGTRDEDYVDPNGNIRKIKIMELEEK